MKIGVACAVALAVGCEPEPLPEPPPPPRWAYSPPTPSLPLAPVRGRIGRAQAPQLVPPLGIIGEVGEPLRLVTPWQVPGDGPARVIAYGTVAGADAIELVDIDHGRVLWRDTKACGGPVARVTDKVVVCADTKGIRAVTLDGVAAWQADAMFVAMTEDRVVILGDAPSIRDANSGDELANVKLPKGVSPALINASCGDAGRELFAIDANGKLQRIAEAAGGSKIVWAVPMGGVLSIDACTGDSILVTEPGLAGGTSLVAITRATGKITGRVDGVRGSWPARDDDGRVEIATATSVASWSRDLASSRPLALPPLGELLAKRGDRRLVRATPFAAALLDRHGVRAYVATAGLRAALGDTAIVASSWSGSPGETLHRIAIPPRWHGELRDNAPRHGLVVAAELRDLPASVAADAGEAISRANTAMHGVAAAAIAGDQLYVVPVEREPDDTNGGGVARIDLVEHGVRWLRPDGCGTGTPIGIAVSRDSVVCAALAPPTVESSPSRSPDTASAKRAVIRATSRAGLAGWDWRTDNIDAVAAAGDVVLAFDADRMVALDAGDGHMLGTFASDDGATMRAAPLDLDGATWVVTYERGRVVARLPRVALVAVWSIDVDGIVSAIAPAGDGVLVSLDDGDAYRIDVRTAAITAIPGSGLDWRASHELVTGATAGGPLYGAVPPTPPPKPYVAPTGPPPTFSPPPFSVPIPTPAPIGASWQLDVFESTGGFRTRNDYALAAPVVASRLRGAPASPLVVGFGQHEVLVIDPQHGDPLKRVQLPDDGIAFSTIVDGQPVAGIILGSPLRVVLF